MQRIATVAYADIFEYPLNQEEIYRWWIGDSKTATKRLNSESPYIDAAQGYFFLKGRHDTIRRRLMRAKYSGLKWQQAHDLIAPLRSIASIELVGISGGLSMYNADLEDDIDLFIICSSGTAWVTRLLATFFFDIASRRRRPKSQRVADQVCLNMFVSLDALTLPESERDLYAAHEVLQMTPVFARKRVYESFLMKNRWVKKYLPNAWSWSAKRRPMYDIGSDIDVVRPLLLPFLRCIEPLLRAVQIWYMRARITREVISRSVIRFHPHDARTRVRREFHIRGQQLDIPLDKVFWQLLK